MRLKLGFKMDCLAYVFVKLESRGLDAGDEACRAEQEDRRAIASAIRDAEDLFTGENWSKRWTKNRGSMTFAC